MSSDTDSSRAFQLPLKRTERKSARRLGSTISRHKMATAPKPKQSRPEKLLQSSLNIILIQSQRNLINS